jgi:hypothetical protein
VTGRADRWIRGTTIGSVTVLALIAGTVSYLHMHALVALHGQPGWVAALTPLSVDGMIVAASMTLLAESRSGGQGGVLPWLLLVVGSVASLAANVAVAEPSVIGRAIAAWPSFALIGSYELLIRQVRWVASTGRERPAVPPVPDCSEPAVPASLPVQPTSTQPGADMRRQAQERQYKSAGLDLRLQAWQWATANPDADGSLPSGKAIASRYGRHERWGRLVKAAGSAGEFAEPASP